MGKDLKGKELGKGIYQRKNGIYVGRFVNRFGKREEVRSEKLAECRRLLAKAIADNDSRKNLVNSKILLDEWFEKWMSIYKQDIRISTREIYRHNYKKHISPTLGRFKLSEITNLQIASMLNDLRDVKGLGVEVRNKCRIILGNMYKYAIINDLAFKNPTAGIKIEDDSEDEVRVLSHDEQQDFFACATGTFYYNMFLVQVNSGLRPGEMYGLMLEDLDFDKNIIHVRRTLSYQKYEGDTGKTFHFGPPKTELSKRNVPMTEKCKLALQHQIFQKRAVMQKTSKDIPREFQSLLFTTKYGTPINTQIYTDAIKRIIAEINLQRFPVDFFDSFSPHAFRHTFATRCFESGIDFKVIQAYLGHATLKMTMDLYVHVTGTFAGAEMPKLDKLMSEMTKMGDNMTIEKLRKLEQAHDNIVSFPKMA